MSNLALENLPRQVWAYYHPFYGTPDGPTGRWLTWNEPLWLGEGYGMQAFSPVPDVQERLRHDPDHLLGPGRRSNYSAFYPTLGLYDCLDAATLEQHARWATEASIDGFLWDYMLVGEDNSDKDKPLDQTIYDRSLRIMLDVIGRLDLPLDLCPWYDTYCWYGFSVARIAQDLEYLARVYHKRPNILHIDGRLVVWIYATLARHTISDWERVCEVLGGARGRLFLVAGDVTWQEPEFCAPGLFDGFGQYNYGMESWSAEGVRASSERLRRVAGRNARGFWSAAVGPGFDGRTWHHPGRVVARGLGKLYESMWQEAISGRPSFITVCSFNEWGEGTQIEPCQEYEDLYLKLTAKWADRFKSEEMNWPRMNTDGDG